VPKHLVFFSNFSHFDSIRIYTSIYIVLRVDKSIIFVGFDWYLTSCLEALTFGDNFSVWAFYLDVINRTFWYMFVRSIVGISRTKNIVKWVEIGEDKIICLLDNLWLRDCCNKLRPSLIILSPPPLALLWGLSSLASSFILQNGNLTRFLFSLRYPKSSCQALWYFISVVSAPRNFLSHIFHNLYLHQYAIILSKT